MVREAQRFSDFVQKLRAPTTMAKKEPYCYSWSECDSYGQNCATYTECEQQPSKFALAWEELMDKVYENMCKHGFDEDDVEEWLQAATQTWDELSRRHMQDEKELAQQQTDEAQEYVSGILEGMLNDLRTKTDETQAQMREEAEAQLEEMLQEVERQAQENMDKLEQFVDDSHQFIDESQAEVMGASSATWTPTFDDDSEVTEDAVAFAQASVQNQSNNSNYGYAALAVGVAAAAAYFYKKKNQKPVTNELKETILV